MSFKALREFFYLFCLIYAYYLNLALDNRLYIYLLVLCCLVHFLLISQVRFSNSLFILTIFSTFYPLVILIAEILSIPYHVYTNYQTQELTLKVLLIQTVSLRLILFNLKVSSSDRYMKFVNIEQRNSAIIFYSLLICLLVMIVISTYSKTTVLNGTYSANSDSSIFFEYCIPFIIGAWLYAGSNFKKKLLFLVCVIFAFLPLLYGRRLPFLMVSLLIANLYFLHRYSYRSVFLFVMLGFMGLSFIALLRIGGEGSILSALLNISESGVMENNQGGVVVSAASYLGLIDDGFFDLEFRMMSLLGLIISPFTMGDFSIQETYVNFSAMKYTPIPGNGGLPGVYFFLWCGWVGVFAFSALLNYLIRYKDSNRYIGVYIIFLLVTFPRWYAYNMIILVKMGFWLIFLIYLIDQFYEKSKKQQY